MKKETYLVAFSYRKEDNNLHIGNAFFDLEKVDISAVRELEQRIKINALEMGVRIQDGNTPVVINVQRINL